MGLLDFFKRGKVEGSEELLVENKVKEENIKYGVQDSSNNFEMTIEDVFSITGRGTVVTGQVSRGTIQINDTVMLSNGKKVTITGIEMFRKTLDYAQEGDNVGLLLNGIDKNEVSRGMVITK